MSNREKEMQAYLNVYKECADGERGLISMLSAAVLVYKALHLMEGGEPKVENLQKHIAEIWDQATIRVPNAQIQ